MNTIAVKNRKPEMLAGAGPYPRVAPVRMRWASKAEAINNPDDLIGLGQASAAGSPPGAGGICFVEAGGLELSSLNNHGPSPEK